MNGDLLYVWNAPTYIIKFVISIKNSRKGTAFLRITQYLKTYNSTNNLSSPAKAEQKQKLTVN